MNEDNSKIKKLMEAAKKDPDLKGFSAKKRWVLYCLKMAKGIIQVACQNANISRTQFYEWLKKDSPVFDEKFAEKAQEIKLITTEWVESKLLENINVNDQRAIEFYLVNNTDKYITQTIKQNTDLTSKGESITPFMEILMRASTKENG